MNHNHLANKHEVTALIADLEIMERRLQRIRVVDLNNEVSDDPTLMFHIGGDLRALQAAESHLTSVRNLLRTLSYWDVMPD